MKSPTGPVVVVAGEHRCTAINEWLACVVGTGVTRYTNDGIFRVGGHCRPGREVSTGLSNCDVFCSQQQSL
jgi:hypothetical protein